jgi:Flp pilus assembly pilin Flp
VHHGLHQVQPQSFLLKELTAAWRREMSKLIRKLWSDDAGQDIAEYAVMLAVILVLVVGTVRLIGSNANTAFSNVASSIQ